MNGWAADPLVFFFIALGLLCLMLAFLAAWSFAKSPVKPRYKRTSREVDASPEEASAFPHLFGK